MIFLTVGTQLPFDRLAGAVNRWAGMHPGHEVIAQVGPTEMAFSSMRCERFLSPGSFEELFGSADLIVAHAGMGTILSAAERRKPLLVMPRRASLGEHRNEHQMATATRLESRLGLTVAWEENEVAGKIDSLLAQGAEGAPVVSATPDRSLLSFVRAFVFGDANPQGSPQPATGLWSQPPAGAIDARKPSR